MIRKTIQSVASLPSQVKNLETSVFPWRYPFSGLFIGHFQRFFSPNLIFFEKISPFDFGSPALFSVPFTVGQVLEEYEPRVDEEEIELTVRDVLSGQYLLRADVCVEG